MAAGNLPAVLSPYRAAFGPMVQAPVTLHVMNIRPCSGRCVGAAWREAEVFQASLEVVSWGIPVAGQFSPVFRIETSSGSPSSIGKGRRW